MRSEVVSRGRSDAIGLVILFAVVVILISSCASVRERTMSDLDRVLITRVTVDADEIEPGAQLAVSIHVLNRGNTEARFGDARSGPWLQVIYVGDSGLPDGWIGVGEALPAFVVGPGQTFVMNRTVRVSSSVPGRYLVELDNNLQKCGKISLLAIPAMLRIRPAPQGE